MAQRSCDGGDERGAGGDMALMVVLTLAMTVAMTVVATLAMTMAMTVRVTLAMMMAMTVVVTVQQTR
jgi:hypothetical protein